MKEQRVKHKVVLVKDMKASGGLDIYPLILNLGPRWKRVVVFLPDCFGSEIRDMTTAE
jgi:hypothetical protein